jgi:hypothetical protein
MHKRWLILPFSPLRGRRRVFSSSLSLSFLPSWLSSSTPAISDFAVFLGSEGHWRTWGNLLYSVRTGGSAFEQIFGMQLFDYFAGQP